MPRLLLVALLATSPGCLLYLGDTDDPPPVAQPCPPSEPPLVLADGPYGTAAQPVDAPAAYPSFRSDYPKSLRFDRAAATATIKYLHENHSVVEQWTVGALTQPVIDTGCSRNDHEQGALTLVEVTVDGVAGDPARYTDWSVRLIAGATLEYRNADGRTRVDHYRHGFAPIFGELCPHQRPLDGDACNEHAVCLYDKAGASCTARCDGEEFRSFSCE